MRGRDVEWTCARTIVGGAEERAREHVRGRARWPLTARGRVVRGVEQVARDLTPPRLADEGRHAGGIEPRPAARQRGGDRDEGAVHAGASRPVAFLRGAACTRAFWASAKAASPAAVNV